MAENGTTTNTAVDYDAAGRTAAIDATAKQAADAFNLAPSRIADALHVLDLLAASAWDVGRTAQPGDKPPFDLLEKSKRRWAYADAETLRLAYDLVNKLHNRAAVL